MSYKDYIINSLSKLYIKYETANTAISKKLLMERIKIYLSDLNKIKYEESNNFIYNGNNDV